MDFKKPENNAKYYWTRHSLMKMQFYGLSASRVIRILRHPKRIEKGIAPKTVAGMQPAGSKKNPMEIWVMYQERGQKNKKKDIFNPDQKVIISAWRYPGVSPKNKPIKIPDEVLIDLESALQEV
ncbi:MAG: hypothetical protein COV31_00755 [Candidatus Yanofskybacteria bacterium CG10_big_fil_rev_8_21_14_0_10_46_23]|uniref:Uncharacterized protein n=1 Tax=Candidatus Yanofskybacteria bacterium CG10_big_fil_rev_8_21_14_0_10_46_23 TaxID=1975098 RepID=A0A2H0R4C9_9BACT|nr:MAG: hypothetical protein COV31_00755 [Candidatus Yanofskybacteria bacterium CG10_big_fil_rev_8_21_14_0_10_46_23]